MTFNIDSIVYRLGENQKRVHQICIENGRDYERLITRSGFEIVHRTMESDQVFFTKFLNEKLDIVENDFIILVNQSMPSLIPGKIPKLFLNRTDVGSIGFLEVSDGCTGFSRALIIANSMLDSGTSSRVHIICAEKYSQYYDDQQESVSPIFSDAISVATISRDGRNRIVGVRFLNTFADSQVISVDRDDAGSDNLKMEGAKVLNWALREVPRVVSELLGEHGLSTKEVSSWYVHQGSKIVVETLLESLGVESSDNFTAAQLGNTVSSTIPIMLSKSGSILGEPFIPKGYSVIMGFGVGLSIVAILLEVTA